MRLDWTTDARNGVTLVSALVTNDGTDPRRVRVANRLDGAVWFPRRRGVPEAGWDDGGFEGVLAPGETRALGYASPADGADPPVEVAWTERAASGGDASATTVFHDLGDPRPPGDAVAAEQSPDRSAVPDAVMAWLAALETRIERAERAELADGGKRDAGLGDDRAALRAVARRVDRLRERVDGLPASR